MRYIGSDTNDHRALRTGGEDAQHLGWLAGMLLIGSAIAIAVTTPILPGEISHGPVLLSAAVSVVAGLAMVLIPWHRMPRQVLLLPAFLSAMSIPVAAAFMPEAMPFYLPFVILTFVFVGFSQTYVWSFVLVPIVALSLATGDHDTATRVNFAVILATGLLVGLALTYSTMRSRQVQMVGEALLNASSDLHQATDRSVVASVVRQATERLIEADLGMVFEGPLGTQHFSSIPASGEGPSARFIVDGAGEPTGIVAALRARRAVFISEPRGDPRVNQRLLTTTDSASMLYVPMQTAEVHGAIVVAWQGQLRSVDPFAVHALEILAQDVGFALTRIDTAAFAKRDATLDPLTGLQNRRGLESRLHRLAPGTAVVALDLDWFKAVNDDYGHGVGDEVLVSFAQCLLQSSRGSDDCGRTGGEEFVLLIDRAGADGSLGVVARLRENWTSLGPLTTFSAGVAIHEGGLDAAVTLARADEALYDAKANGRNRTELYRTHTAPRQRGDARQHSVSNGPPLRRSALVLDSAGATH